MLSYWEYLCHFVGCKVCHVGLYLIVGEHGVDILGLAVHLSRILLAWGFDSLNLGTLRRLEILKLNDITSLRSHIWWLYTCCALRWDYYLSTCRQIEPQNCRPCCGRSNGQVLTPKDSCRIASGAGTREPSIAQVSEYIRSCRYSISHAPWVRRNWL